MSPFGRWARCRWTYPVTLRMWASSSSVRSPLRVCSSLMIFRPESWPTDSAFSDFFWPTSRDSSVFSHFSSSPAVMFTAARKSSYTSVTVQRPGLVHRFAAGLVALDLVLRVVLGRVDRAARRFGALGDLLLDLALDLLAVAAPRHVVALAQVLVMCHELQIPG